MKILIFSYLVLFISCSDGVPKSNIQSYLRKTDTVFIHDTVTSEGKGMNWQESFGLTHDPDKDSIWGKPVSYYINDNECAATARDFYYGYFRPADDGATDDLLRLATTDNKKLRPFYRWCLTKTIQVSDGALGEHTGQPARRYAEKFPREFFEYVDQDTSGNRYQDYVNAILYSGFYDIDDYKKPEAIRARMISKMKQNCKGCSEEILKRIPVFAKDCFPRAEGE